MNLQIFKCKKGSVIILFAAALTALSAVAAMVVDIGYAFLEQQRFQNAVDSAAIAAAHKLPDVSEAIAAANHFIEVNGFSSSDISVHFSDSGNTVNIKGIKTIPLFFARIIGFENKAIGSNASASVTPMGQVFNYALFSGSPNATLTLNGSNIYIEGSSHSNKNFVANGSRLTITGVCEAVSTITVNGSNINIGARKSDSPFVDMPDFSEEIKVLAEQYGQVFNGNKTFNGNKINLDSPIYVNGNVTINGSSFEGKGCILAEGNITFNGDSVSNTSDDAACFYSKNGNITINGSKAKLDGIVYAPNGSITFNGDNQTVNGRVIGHTVVFNGSNQSIISGTNELKSLPHKRVKLTR